MILKNTIKKPVVCVYVCVFVCFFLVSMQWEGLNMKQDSLILVSGITIRFHTPPKHAKCSVLTWFANSTKANTAASSASAWHNRPDSDAKPLRVTQEHNFAQQSSSSFGSGITHWLTSFGFQYYSLPANRIWLRYYDTPQLPLQLYSLFQVCFLVFMTVSSAVLSASESGFLYSVLTPSHSSMFPHIWRFFHSSFQHCLQQIPEFIDVIAWLVIQQKYQTWQNKKFCSSKVPPAFTWLHFETL